MEVITVIGLVAAALTTLAFLPQVIRTWRTKSTEDLSLGMYLCLCTGVFLWAVYGFLMGDIPIILANVLTFCLATSILVIKVNNSLRLRREEKLERIVASRDQLV